MIINIIVFIFILALLVLSHELGHFLAARWAKMKVEEFGFGLPPRIWGKTRGETTYSLNALPIGGFVKILGEDGQDIDNPRSFASKSPYQRAIVLIAGVAMNFLLAIILYIIGFTIGIPAQYSDQIKDNIKDTKLQIVGMEQNSPAKLAGLKELDIIEDVDGKRFEEVGDLRQYLIDRGGSEVLLKVKRGAKTLSVKITPLKEIPSNKGPTGMIVDKVGILQYPFWQSIYYGTKETFVNSYRIFYGFYYIIKNLITTGKAPAGIEVGGPVKIAALTFIVTGLGIGYLINFIALLSLTLFIINILPFPALDGGRLVFVAVEAIKGSPLNRDLEKKIHAVGFIILLVLIILLTVRDILKLS